MQLMACYKCKLQFLRMKHEGNGGVLMNILAQQLISEYCREQGFYIEKIVYEQLSQQEKNSMIMVDRFYLVIQALFKSVRSSRVEYLH